ncbi:Plastid transcriptionally active isoform 1 [Hibiscus syriacus]|uniref:Plastid transcriptionally active isoform 1 n=1 Tax=Hibiscus syriacus TaxID=106335 RepID=A0A6A2ZMD6_HIBSY|nr:Plastid transcriptionally active isoform 1 [Hibiscus syriacus]
MATFFISSYLTALTCLVFFFKILAAEQSSSFSFKSFGKDPKFEANIALYGDAHVGNDGSWIQLTDSVSWSAGAAMYEKPIKLVGGKVRNFASFSTYFSFSMSRGNGDGLAFIMVPSSSKVDVLGNSSFGVSLGLEKSKSRIVAVEFDTFRDVNHGDLDENHVGQMIRCFRIWSKLWNDEVFVGLSSSNGKSSQTCFIRLWSFKLRQVPNWMHSQPIDPQVIAKNPKPLTAAPKNNKCFWKVLAVFVFGGACGALTASLVLYLLSVFGDRRPVGPEECVADPVGPEECVADPVDFEFIKKVKVVVVDDAVKDGNN